MSKEIKDNWYVVLGLDFYPDAEENEEKIKQKIEEKKLNGKEEKFVLLIRKTL